MLRAREVCLRINRNYSTARSDDETGSGWSGWGCDLLFEISTKCGANTRTNACRYDEVLQLSCVYYHDRSKTGRSVPRSGIWSHRIHSRTRLANALRVDEGSKNIQDKTAKDTIAARDDRGGKVYPTPFVAVAHVSIILHLFCFPAQPTSEVYPHLTFENVHPLPTALPSVAARRHSLYCTHIHAHNGYIHQPFSFLHFWFE